MTYEPNEAEIHELTKKLAGVSRNYMEYGPIGNIARHVLIHYEPRTREQRCKGNGYLYGLVLMGDPGPVEQRCPGCVNCAVEPAKDGGLARGMRESVTTSGTGVAQLTTPPVAPITIALDDRTLRGLMAALLTQNEWRDAENAPDQVDKLLAEIDKAKEEAK